MRSKPIPQKSTAFKEHQNAREKLFGPYGPSICYLLATILLLILIGMWVARWDDIRGTYLIKETQWRYAPGLILNSRVYRQSSTKSSSWRFETRYSYTINNVVYQGSQVGFGNSGFSEKSTADALQKRYSIGKKVQVAYLQEEPTFCALDPMSKMDLDSKVVLWMTTILWVIGLVMVVYFDVATRDERLDESL